MKNTGLAGNTSELLGAHGDTTAPNLVSIGLGNTQIHGDLKDLLIWAPNMETVNVENTHLESSLDRGLLDLAPLVRWPTCLHRSSCFHPCPESTNPLTNRPLPQIKSTGAKKVKIKAKKTKAKGKSAPPPPAKGKTHEFNKLLNLKGTNIKISKHERLALDKQATPDICDNFDLKVDLFVGKRKAVPNELGHLSAFSNLVTVDAEEEQDDATTKSKLMPDLTPLDDDPEEAEYG